MRLNTVHSDNKVKDRAKVTGVGETVHFKQLIASAAKIKNKK